MPYCTQGGSASTSVKRPSARPSRARVKLPCRRRAIAAGVTPARRLDTALRMGRVRITDLSGIGRPADSERWQSRCSVARYGLNMNTCTGFPFSTRKPCSVSGQASAIIRQGHAPVLVSLCGRVDEPGLGATSERRRAGRDVEFGVVPAHRWASWVRLGRVDLVMEHLTGS